MLLAGVAFPQQSWRFLGRLGDIWNRENRGDLREGWGTRRIIRSREGLGFSSLLFEHDLRANASRLSRGKTGAHFAPTRPSGSGSCAGKVDFTKKAAAVDAAAFR